VLFKSPAAFKPLATLGDAIASFLKDGPDPSTQTASCLLTKQDVVQGRWGRGDGEAENKYWVPSNHYWFRTISFSRWAVTGLVWGVCVAAAVVGLLLDLTADNEAGRLSDFGSRTGGAKKIVMDGVAGEAGAAVMAALPHVLVGVLYLVVNGVLSGYWVSQESSEFAVTCREGRALRVSEGAEGLQRTSLYLTLPRPVSWGVMTLFAGMGFVVSQSFFLVSVRDVGEEGTVRTVSALAFSGVGLLTLLACLVLLAVFVLGLGMRRAPAAGMVNGGQAGNPMAMPGGSCSAVISARCHRLPGQPRGIWKMPVVWGVVREGVGMEPSHCSFTTGRAAMVEVGRNYA